MSLPVASHLELPPTSLPWWCMTHLTIDHCWLLVFEPLNSLSRWMFLLTVCHALTWGAVLFLLTVIKGVLLTTISDSIYWYLSNISKCRSQFLLKHQTVEQSLWLKLLPSLPRQWTLFQSHLDLFLLPSWQTQNQLGLLSIVILVTEHNWMWIA